MRFWTFRIYDEIRVFIKEIYKLADSLPKKEQYELASQLRRAATSILLNLAEGSMKLSDAELNRHIIIAIGSTAEVVAILDICLDQKYINSSIHDTYMIKCEAITKQLYGFCRKLKHK